MSPPSCTAIWLLPPPPCLCPSRAPASVVGTAGTVGHHNRTVNLRDADTRDHHISHLSSVAGRQGGRGRALSPKPVETQLNKRTRSEQHNIRQRLSRTTARHTINSMFSPRCM